MVRQSKDRISVGVHDGRCVREGEVDVTVALGQLLELAAQMRLPVATEVLVLVADVEPREVHVASGAGDVEAGQFHDEAVAGAVDREPHLEVDGGREVGGADYCFVLL